MPIGKEALDALARSFASTMTSIRGRRVHRLLMREFSRFDDVFAASAEDGTAALFALADDGGAALRHTDSGGAAVTIAEWARREGATVTVHCDLLKDLLPTVGWTVWHPGFARVAGALTIARLGFRKAIVAA